jgi:hypothetical protein
MDLRDRSNVVADLITIGRKTGVPRTVELRFLYLNGRFYATSSKIRGTARQITDEALRKEILTLRDSPPQLDRVVFEITPKR